MEEPKFSWPALPQSDSDFDALMQAVDNALAEKGLRPFKRPLHVPRLLWEAFGWSGPIFPDKQLANHPGFEGQVLMAKAYRWYEQYYGEQLKADLAFGHFPARLGNTLWRVRAGLFYGTVEFFVSPNLANRGSPGPAPGRAASLNVLSAVEDLPQGLASRLSHAELLEFAKLFQYALQSLMWRDTLRGELFEIARADYDASTEDLMAGRFGQSRWGAQQAVEKTIKGLLKVAGTAIPTSGPKGHDLNYLGELLAGNHGIPLSTAVLGLATCSPKARYGEEPSTEAQALSANYAVLEVLEQLRTNPKTEALLATAKKL